MMVISIFLEGCSTYVPRYSPSVDNVKVIRSFPAGKKINIGEFTSKYPRQSSLLCRAVGPISTPDGEPFADYVRKAFIDELRMAELYSKDANLTIKSHLESIEFNSITGKWYFVLVVSSNTNQSFTVEESYDYATSFVGSTACNMTAQALLPAVQALIKNVVNHPSFRKML